MSVVRQHLEVVAPSTTRFLDPNQRDVQRDALRDLVALASDSAATEARIEHEFRTSTEQAGKDFEKSRYYLGQQITAEQAGAEQLHKQHAFELMERFEVRTTAVREEHALARETIERNHEPTDRKSRIELEQAEWLADSVLEFAQNQARAEDNRIKEICRTYADA